MRKKKLIVITGISVIALSAVFFLVLLHTPLLQRYIEKKTEEFLSEKFGSRVSLGELRFSLTGSVEIRDAAIANAAPFEGDWIRVKRLYAEVKMLSLLRGEAYLKTLEVDEPEFNLLYDRSRNNNLPGRDRKDAQREMSTSREGRRRNTRELTYYFQRYSTNRLELTDGVFHFEYPDKEMSIHAQGINIDLSTSGIKGKYAGSADIPRIDFTMRDKLQIHASINLETYADGNGCEVQSLNVKFIQGKSSLNITGGQLTNYRDPSLKFDFNSDIEFKDAENALYFDSPVEGTLSLKGRGSGPAEDLSVNADLWSRELKIDRIPVDSLKSEIGYYAEVFKFSEFHVNAAGGEIEGRGDIDLSNEDSVFSGEFAWKELSSREFFSLYEAGWPGQNFRINGSSTFEWKDFKPEKLKANGKLQINDDTDSPHEGFQGHLDISVENEKIRLAGSPLKWDATDVMVEAAEINFDGEISGKWNISIRDLGRDMRRILLFLGVQYEDGEETLLKGGELYAFGGLSGELSRPAVDALAEATEIDLGTFEIDEVNAIIQVDRDKVLFDVKRIALGDSSSWARGTYYFDQLQKTKADEHIEEASINGFYSKLWRHLPLMKLHGRFSGIEAANFFPVLSRGKLDGEIHLISPPDNESDKFLHIRSVLKEAKLGGMSIDEANLDLSADGRQLKIDVLNMVHGDKKLISLSGTLGASGHYRIEGNSDAFPVHELNKPFPALGPLKADISLKIEGEGKLSDPKGEIGISASGVEYGGNALGETNVTIAVENKRANLDIVFLDELITGDGEIILDGDMPFSVSLNLNSEEQQKLDNLVNAFIAETVKISSYGKANVTGSLLPLNLASLDCQLSELGIKAADYHLSSDEPLVIQGNYDKMVLKPVRFSGLESQLDVSATVGSMSSIDLNADGVLQFALLSHFIPEFQNPKGRIILEIQGEGPFDSPDLQGDIRAEEVFFRLSPYNLAIEDVHGGFSVSSRRIDIDYFVGMAGQSPVTVTGQIGLEGFLPEYFDFEINGERNELNYPEGMQTELDLSLKAAGPPESLLISGDVDIREAIYSKRFDYRTVMFEESKAVFLSADRSVEPRLQTEASFSPRININLNAPEGIFIRNNIADLEMKCDLNIVGDLSDPGVAGRVEVLKGSLTYQGRRFQIINGSFDFVDPETINPYFEFQTEAEISNYSVYLNINGRLDGDIYVDLSSSPPLGEVDLWALITLGKTTEMMKQGGAEYGGMEAASFLTGQIQDEIEKRAQMFGGFDEFQINPIFSDPESGAGARLTVKKNIGDRLSVIYSTDISSSGKQLVFVEYKINDKMYLVGERNEDGALGADLKMRWEFK